VNTETFQTIADQMTGRGLIAGQLTFGECVLIAETAGAFVGNVVLAEAMIEQDLNYEAVTDRLFNVFTHNRKALVEGCTHGSSDFFGRIGAELTADNAAPLFGDRLVDRALAYTLAAQVGNHGVGLQPCAGTGDACTYTGLMQAMREIYGETPNVCRAMAVTLKLGTFFREGKSTTGCNMEGFGAGAAASAAAFTELADGCPSQVAHAVVMALSPTIATPCTPRVMVPGLCATHIGGGVLIGRLASQLSLNTKIPVTVPVDIMLAMAAAIHPISAEAIVPEVVRHMRPFFLSRADVETHVPEAQKLIETAENETLMAEATARIRALARRARSILNPFGPVVAGGSSQAVGSPANAARLAHHLARGPIRAVEIELAPELFARRAINFPAILAAAVFGAPPGDREAQHTVFNRILETGVKVTFTQVPEAKRQRIIVRAKDQDGAVTSENMGGARIRLIDASPSRAAAIERAKTLEIEIVE
jgi:L-serine dehydratase